MSKGELLLRWASCFTEIRRPRIQAAAERLCVPNSAMCRNDPRNRRYLEMAKRLTDNLIRLGHLEELARNSLRTVPSTFVPLSGKRHLIVGARSEKILNDFRANDVSVEIVKGASLDDPDVWILEGNEEKVASVSQQFHVATCRNRWAEVLASLPTVSEILIGAQEETIPAEMERWNHDDSNKRWTGKNVSADPGFYRTLRSPRQWYLRQKAGAPTVRLDTPERRFAAAWLLSSNTESKAFYNSEKSELVITTVGFRLPLLIDRGLILSSGRLPGYHSEKNTYVDIDTERARQVARILETKLEISK